MGLFEQFPYTNFHELNLNWLIEQLKTVINSAVLSVNGQTGEVVLYQDANVEFPSINDTSWNIVRSTAGSRLGVAFANGYMYVVSGNALDRVYTQNNPPTFPVSSVNGQTGAVVLYQDAGVRLPNVDDTFMNIRRQIDTAGSPAIVGIEVDKTKASRMNGTQRVQLYDTENPPPYPVSSVNGQTGAVMLAIPFNAPLSSAVWTAATPSDIGQWGIQRDTALGTVKVYYVANSTDNVPEAYIEYKADANTPAVTKKLLTTDDIPSGSGVVSINGQTGVVTLYGQDIKLSSGDNTTVTDAIAAKVNNSDLAFVIDGKQCSSNVSAGDIVILVDSTITGRNDGIYIAANSVSANTDFTSADLTVLSKGVLNSLLGIMNDKYYNIGLKPGTNTFAPPPNSQYGFLTCDGYYDANGAKIYVDLEIDTHLISSVTSVTMPTMTYFDDGGLRNALTTPTIDDIVITGNGVRIRVVLPNADSNKAYHAVHVNIGTNAVFVCT